MTACSMKAPMIGPPSPMSHRDSPSGTAMSHGHPTRKAEPASAIPTANGTPTTTPKSSAGPERGGAEQPVPLARLGLGPVPTAPVVDESLQEHEDHQADEQGHHPTDHTSDLAGQHGSCQLVEAGTDQDEHHAGERDLSAAERSVVLGPPGVHGANPSGAGRLPDMPVRYPAALRPGDRIAVTAPSAGVPEDLRPRLDVCIAHLEGRGYEVVLGTCLDGTGVVSAPARERAAEVTAFLTDPAVAAVVPPWGGELAVDVLPHLDFEALSAADPTWLVGYSDISTLLLALTARTGIATLHGQNLMDTPYRVPAPLASWLDVVTLGEGGTSRQGASTHHRAHGYDSWQDDPGVTEFTLDTPGGWSLLSRAGADQEGAVQVSGRLVGGCVETVSTLAGTAYGDLGAFAAAHAPEGLIVYLEAAEEEATSIARHLWRMRLAGWFDQARAVLVGRTRAPDSSGLSQRDAVRSALGDLPVPVVLDVDCGHVPPHLALVNGALTEVVVGPAGNTVTQHLI